MRYFPDSHAKNCYSFPVSRNQTYLIRGTFFYGYYDNATTLPSFQMGIDGTIVANITFDDAYTFVYHEFSYPSQVNNNVTFLCLLRDSSNSGPFISAISLSQLSNDYHYDSYRTFVSLFSSKQNIGWISVEMELSGMSTKLFWFQSCPSRSSCIDQVVITSWNAVKLWLDAFSPNIIK